MKTSTNQYSVLDVYKKAAQKCDTEWNQLNSYASFNEAINELCKVCNKCDYYECYHVLLLFHKCLISPISIMKTTAVIITAARIALGM